MTKKKKSKSTTCDFTVRLQPQLVDQIQARANLNRRTRNTEISVLLEEALDASVQKDLEAIKQISSQTQNVKILAV